MIILAVIVGYFVGTISGSYILGHLLLHQDVRRLGSGNAGTTNAMRVFGRKIGTMTFLIDVLKGSAVVYLFAPHLSDTGIALLILATVIGHDYPFYMNFRGGKGVATTLGGFMVIEPKLAAFAVIVGVFSALFTGYVSFGSLMFLTAMVLGYFCIGPVTLVEALAVLFILIIGIFRHQENIIRIIAKSERRLSFSILGKKGQ
ncbi:MAG: glycerol-3-phosphate 1-O-acyltransferase PlsY [Tissierellia bacterium]|nr:glycerol-3-phosphate 1-O-acyltransferase PlsY [Tissierellia bacterium]